MSTVCILNLIKAAVMLFIWFLRGWQSSQRHDADKEVLYTLGDAISSFMRRPDDTTRDMGLATKWDFESKRKWSTRLVKQDPLPSTTPREFQVSKYRWWQAASPKRWFIVLFLWLLVTGVAIRLMGLALPSLHRRSISTTIPDLWKMGSGALTPYTYLVVGLPRGDPAGLISNVLLANLPQLILSMLYILYNTILGTFLVQREFSQMNVRRKPLRVSEPIGIQRSSYFISLPLRYGIPSYVSPGLIHWLISKSLFLARVTAVHPDGSINVENSFSTCGYSPIAVFC
ncbi:hypothetical protein B0H63DRAFT_241771 [Podospora didyma]|uniref:Uncharacterized protein n=1 Tax=Podospora didyma TaxID=330526 RepID=A0AAE0NCE2_9PEZI|nr:hypothetical protein B0H63DRAFT_241771 [Podospora didyma]